MTKSLDFLLRVAVVPVRFAVGQKSAIAELMFEDCSVFAISSVRCAGKPTSSLVMANEFGIDSLGQSLD